MSKVKALKITISGSYRTATKDIVDFEDVSGVIPFVDEDLAAMHVRGRYAVLWVKAEMKGDEKMYPKRVEDMRQVFIDNIEEIQIDQFSYIGKNIKELSYKELQDLATAKDLRRIQLPKELSGMSLREMRETAYLQYSEHVLKIEIEHNSEDPEGNSMIDYAKLPPLHVDGEGARRDEMVKLNNDDIIEQEQVSTKTEDSALSLEDLKEIATSKNLKFHPNIGFDALHAKVYGNAAA